MSVDVVLVGAEKATEERPGETAELTWQDLACGQLVLLGRDEEVPADVVVVACSNQSGHCYVETVNLDGETNLKIKEAEKQSQKVMN